MRRYTEEQRQLMMMLAAHKNITTAFIARALGIHRESANSRLRTLRSRGVVVRNGFGPGCTWSLLSGYEQAVQAHDDRMRNARREYEARKKVARQDAEIDDAPDMEPVQVFRDQWEPVRRSVPYSVFTLGQQNGL